MGCLRPSAIKSGLFAHRGVKGAGPWQGTAAQSRPRQVGEGNGTQSQPFGARLDGIGLTRKLREDPKFKTIPILILTTESSDQMKQAGRAAGATGWLVKPFDPNRLIEVIKKVIR